MADPTIDLKYGTGELSIQIPRPLVMDLLSPNVFKKTETDVDILQNALANPIETGILSDIVPADGTIAIIVDDLTRPTPIALMLPLILDHLNKAGIQKNQIKIAVALGTHRPMTRDELDSRLGRDIVSSYTIINEDCVNKEAFVFLGETRSGIPAWVHSEVAGADFRIGLGSISPHTDAGFSGGAKIILPGVCGLDTIKGFHEPQVGASVRLGNVNAPLREELEQFVCEKISLDFLVNVIQTQDKALHAAVAGDYIAAHRKGCEYAKQVYGIAAAHPYSIVVSNAYPTQNDLWQSTKALSSAASITKKGGHLILVAHCEEGLATHPLYADYIGMKPEALVTLMKENDPEDAVACSLAYDIARLKKEIHIDLVSHGLSRQDADTMGFGYFETVESALMNAMTKTCANRGAIVTHGGVSWPYMEKMQHK